MTIRVGRHYALGPDAVDIDGNDVEPYDNNEVYVVDGPSASGNFLVRFEVAHDCAIGECEYECDGGCDDEDCDGSCDYGECYAGNDSDSVWVKPDQLVDPEVAGSTIEVGRRYPLKAGARSTSGSFIRVETVTVMQYDSWSRHYLVRYDDGASRYVYAHMIDASGSQVPIRIGEEFDLGDDPRTYDGERIREGRRAKVIRGPDSDGDYLVRMVGTPNEYEWYVKPKQLKVRWGEGPTLEVEAPVGTSAKREWLGFAEAPTFTTAHYEPPPALRGVTEDTVDTMALLRQL